VGKGGRANQVMNGGVTNGEILFVNNDVGLRPNVIG